MKNFTAILVLVLLSGCSTIQGWIPSFSDTNQSRSIVTVQARVAAIDCSKSQAAQVQMVLDEITWFTLYSDSKGRSQQDVLRLVEPMRATAQDWHKRVSAEGYRENTVYCQLKKSVLTEQSTRAAKAVLGRF